ncbi:ribosome biogenesis GTPase Der [uncultured Desulfovibrio sp.]|uniref:GTPase Der n=1 Tax=Candidatus Desulfovibrio intestinavium TaxID=2838534 RepID=A0A9D2HQH0_9BACT|nr:ribosome biogenesis GTPase Der [uncultured Desulfovibrio sp.]HJA80044.1 ribosome biogenesis GTPase Der [Candidatus Desulfovibrio intestinavium]
MAAVLPGIVLVGRPNVGKSTLFNRLIRSNRAITHDRPGVTRDRMEGTVRRKGLPDFMVVDTGGITLDAHAAVTEGPEGIRGFEADILRQAEAAMKDACGVAFVVDARDGLLPLDEFLAAHVRRMGLPTLCVVNKVDGIEREDEQLAEFHALGFPVLAVSAEHGHNIRALVEELAALLPDAPDEDERAAGEADAPLRLAMLGRPNAGKSSLINALSGEERMIVSDVAGTTRDSVDVRFTKDGRDYVFVDTAGVRRRTRITDIVEKYSVNAAIKSTTKADVTLLTLDATEQVSQQDKRLMDLLDNRKIPFMVLINKCDLVPAGALRQLEKNVRQMLAFCGHVPILPVSALTGKGLEKILPLARTIHEECGVRVPTGQLNRAMEDVLARHQPPVVKRVRAKFFYLTQAETQPPTFVFFVSDAERVPESYARYLERSLRKIFGISHAPMRIRLRSSHKKDKK